MVGRGSRICPPQSRNVLGQLADPSTVQRCQRERLFLEETVVVVVDAHLISQRLLPLPLQGARHQTVLRLDLIVLPAGSINLVAAAFQTLVPLPVQRDPLQLDILGLM